MQAIFDAACSRAQSPVGVSTLAALVLAASAGALTGQIVVTPTSPTFGKNASIRVQITQRAGERLPSILYLRVISPRGALCAWH